MRKVNIQYRFLDNTGILLSDVMKQALSHVKNGVSIRDKTGHRIYHLKDGTVLLNRCDEHPDWLFGELVTFKDGENIRVIEDSLDKKVLDFEQIKTPEGRQLIRGITYWLIVENHLLIIQAANIPVTDVSKYLIWFLTEYTSLNKDSLVFRSQIHINQDNAPPIDTVQIRSISGTSANNFIPVTSTFDEKKISDESMIFSILKYLGLGEANIDRLKEQAGSDGEISLDLSIKIKEKRRKKLIGYADAVSIFSNIEDDEVILRGKHGKQVGKMMNLSYPEARVEEKGSFLDPDSSQLALIEAFRYFINNMYITSNIGDEVF